MQDLVGIVRQESEMREALERIEALRARAARAGIDGNREYNNGWHTAVDLHNLLTVSEAIARAGARAQGKPRRAFPRGLPEQVRRVRRVQHRDSQGRRTAR